MTELTGRFDGWRSFEDRFTASMAMAAAQPADIYAFDTDFRHWPLSARSTLDAFHQWAMASRSVQCQLLALNMDELPRDHPRWLAWRQTWSHRVKCWLACEETSKGVPATFILKDQVGIRIMDERHGAGIWSRDPVTMGAWKSEIDVILQRSQEAAPPTTLGL